jgi:tetratricopeptide (TPR) repeat protein
MREDIKMKKTKFSDKLTSRLMMGTAAIFLLASCSGQNEAKYASNSQTSPVPTVKEAPNSLMRLANEMADSKDYAAAIPLYKSAHKWHPFQVSPLVGLGDSYSAIGQYEDATKTYEDALGRDEKNLGALKGLAKAYIALGRSALAVPLLHTASMIDSNDADVISNLALTLELAGNHAAALGVYQEGLANNPNSLKILNNYGLSLALRSQHEDAIQYLKQAAQHKDSGASHRQNLALAYALSGNETMSYRLLSIDNGPDISNDSLSFFRLISALPEDRRFQAMMDGAVEDKVDNTEYSNYNQPEDNLVQKVTVARLIDTEDLPMEEPVPEPVPEPPKAPEPEMDDGDVPPLLGPQGWALQIASYRHKNELSPGWKILLKKYPHVLEGLEPRRSEIDFGKDAADPKGKYYRLNAGPLTSLAEAKEKCAIITKSGTDCWVRVPEVTEGEMPEDAPKRLFKKEKSEGKSTDVNSSI